MPQRILTTALLIALLTGGSSCTWPENRVSLRIDPALAVLIPDGVKYMMVIKLEKLKDSGIYQRHLKDRFAAQFDEFARNTGMDPRKDLWEIVICSDGKRNVMLGRGKFPIADLEPRLEREGARRMRYKSFNFFGDDEKSATFVNVSTALVGSTEWLKEIVDRNNKPGLPAALQPLLEAVPPGSQVFALFDGLPMQIPEVKDPNFSNLARVANSIDKGWMAMNVSRGLNFTLLANCRNREMAEGLHGAARGLLGFARLSTSADQKEMLKAIDSVDIKLEQPSAVRISTNLTEDVVDEFVSTGLGKLLRDVRPGPARK